MKKFHFKPLPGLTVIVLIMLTILIALGNWQYQRLGWKTELLDEIDKAANSAPLTSLREVAQALEGQEPLDFRRIGIIGEFRSEPPFKVYVKPDSNPGSQSREIHRWRLYAPVSQDAYRAFAAMNIIGENEEAQPYSGSKQLVGYVRVAREGKHMTKSTPEQNRWFGFNPMPETHNWADRGVDVRYYLDIVPGESSAANLPVKYPELRNNHFSYMLTWYSLAFILLIYYLLMHRKVGRLGWS